MAAAVCLLLPGLTRSSPDTTPPSVPALDVPYVPQKRALCGGAAVEMVLRFWGARGVYADDFAPLIEEGAGGIRTDRLAAGIRERGWEATPFDGSLEFLATETGHGRPIIALIEVAPDRYHYVVVTRASPGDGRVVFHDPAIAPNRIETAVAFDRGWKPARSWCLRILPDTSTVAVPAVAGAVPPAAPHGEYARAIDAAIDIAATGDLTAAASRLESARSAWPDSARAWRELAGVRFLEERWSDAESLALTATRLDPSDAHAWRLLAAVRFRRGDREGALEAWNRVGELRLDLTRMAGLERTRYPVLAGYLGLPPRTVVTPARLRQARRRLGDFPTRSASRLDYRPVGDGLTELDLALFERPLVVEGIPGAVAVGLETLTESTLGLRVAGPTGGGELWSFGWRWTERRPRLSIGIQVPRYLGLPGVLRLEGSRERQTYAAAAVTRTSPDTNRAVIEERRRRAALTISDWTAGGLRLTAGAAYDHWEGRGGHGALSAGVEQWFGDDVTLGVSAEGWLTPDGGPFAAGSLEAGWTRASAGRGTVLRVSAAGHSASARAPLALWPGAGTGRGRTPLLRAHPLLEEDVVTGPAFGRSLVHGTVELERRLVDLGPARIGGALFLDVAQADPFRELSNRGRRFADAGVGLRVAGPGSGRRLHLDAAVGLEDREAAVSIGWTESR